MKRRRRYRKKRGSYLKKKVNKNTNRLKLLSRAIEYKFVDTDGDTAPLDVNTTGSSTCLNRLQQGTASNERTGNKVIGRRLTMRGYFANTKGTPEDCVCRVVIVKARDQNNAQQTYALYAQTADTTSFIYDQHKHRFQVLCDKTFTMDTSQHSIIPFYFTQKLKSECTYNGNAGTYADIEDGAYYLFTLSTVAGTVNCPTFAFRSRFYFLDA